jgi:hypothetical protein
MGRITPSFRQLFLSEVEELKRSFYRALLDPAHREAFNLLVRAWCSEDTAMANAFIPCVVDNMNLLANVHNRKCMEELRKRTKEVNEKVLQMEERLAELEKRARES